jgi:hypothetical protein
VLAYVDADCRPPITWLAQVEQRFLQREAVVAVTGPYRFYDWDLFGRMLLRAYDVLVAPPTHWLVHHGLGIGAILYGGNFAVRREALSRIGGFDRRTGSGETPIWTPSVRSTSRSCCLDVCPRWEVDRSGSVRNFCPELLRHRHRPRTDVRAQAFR